MPSAQYVREESTITITASGSQRATGGYICDEWALMRFSIAPAKHIERLVAGPHQFEACARSGLGVEHAKRLKPVFTHDLPAGTLATIEPTNDFANQGGAGWGSVADHHISKRHAAPC